MFGCLLLVSSSMLSAQGRGEWEIAGDRMMKEGDYFTALSCYQKAINPNSTKTELLRKLAFASSGSRDYILAAQYYDKLITELKDAPAEDLYNAALMHKQAGDYLSWERLLRQAYQKREELDERSSKIIQNEYASIHIVSKLLNDSLAINVWNAGSALNSVLAETGPWFLGDTLLLYSTSANEALLVDDFFPEDQVYSLMMARMSGKTVKNIEKIDRRVNTEAYHNANPSTNKDGSVLYFTRCMLGLSGAGTCEIWYSKKNRQKWGKARKLGGDINQAGSSSTHPCIAYVSGKEVIYFASDREGGAGGWDLWYSVLGDGRPGPVVNLGPPVNTPGNEWAVRAYKNEDFYFSSDGHPGLGGYDVFYTKGGYNKWNSPVNLGRPINSSADDLWYSPADSSKPGLLVSNRPGSAAYAGQTCCYDIYFHSIEEPKTISPKEDTLIELYRNKAKELNALLPLDLYFDNDQPDPRSLSDTTNADYYRLLSDYLSQKNLYERMYSRGLPSESANEAKDSIHSFFDRSVASSGTKLQTLSNTLYQQLRKGHRVVLAVRGFASPLNSSAYNEKLAARRIASIVNSLKSAESGLLRPYMTGQNPLLQIRPVPVGEAEAGRVSDNPKDLRNAVYSPQAAQERRVSILYGSVEGYTGISSGLTTIKMTSRDKLKISLLPDDHQLITIKIENIGDQAFFYEGIKSNFPRVEAVIAKNPISPGETADLIILIRGPVENNTPLLEILPLGNQKNKEDRIQISIN